MKTTRSKLLASVTVLGLMAAAVSAVVFSAFSATTANSGNTFSTGSITLTDNDSAAALFTMTGATGGTASTRCIKVDYASTGSLTSTVRLYGATTGDLGPYLDVRIRRGTGSAANCSDFAADAGDYIGQGAGVIYADTLDAYPDAYAGGLVDQDASWSNGETATYEIRVTVQDDNDAQGKSATQTFTWEARTA